MSAGAQNLFNRDALIEELDEEFAQRVARSFLDATDQIPQLLGEAAAASDSEGLRLAAHKLTGACKAIFCEQVANRSSLLEKAAAGGDWAKITEHLPVVQQLYTRLRAEIADYVTAR